MFRSGRKTLTAKAVMVYLDISVRLGTSSTQLILILKLKQRKQLFLQLRTSGIYRTCVSLVLMNLINDPCHLVSLFHYASNGFTSACQST